MKKPYHNDSAYIAEEFQFIDEHTAQTARLAFFKINSYKLSMIKAAFCTSQQELTGIIKGTLLNYTDTAAILADVGFFESEINN